MMASAKRRYDLNRLPMLLAPPGYRCAISGTQAALDLHRGGRFMNQEMNTGSECLLEIEQIADDRNQHAFVVQLRPADSTEEIGNVVDFTPVDNDYIEFHGMNHFQRGFGASHNLWMDLQFSQNRPCDSQELHVAAQQQGIHRNRGSGGCHVLVPPAMRPLSQEPS